MTAAFRMRSPKSVFRMTRRRRSSLWSSQISTWWSCGEPKRQKAVRTGSRGGGQRGDTLDGRYCLGVTNKHNYTTATGFLVFLPRPERELDEGEGRLLDLLPRKQHLCGALT